LRPRAIGPEKRGKSAAGVQEESFYVEPKLTEVPELFEGPPRRLGKQQKRTKQREEPSFVPSVQGIRAISDSCSIGNRVNHDYANMRTFPWKRFRYFGDFGEGKKIVANPRFRFIAARKT